MLRIIRLMGFAFAVWFFGAAVAEGYDPMLQWPILVFIWMLCVAGLGSMLTSLHHLWARIEWPWIARMPPRPPAPGEPPLFRPIAQDPTFSECMNPRQWPWSVYAIVSSATYLYLV